MAREPAAQLDLILALLTLAVCSSHSVVLRAGSLGHSISITWELVKNTDPWVPLLPVRLNWKLLGAEPSPLYFNKLSRGFRRLAMFENQCFSLYTVVLRGSPVRPQTTLSAFKGPLRREEVPESWGRVTAVISKIDKEVIVWRQLLK